MHLLKRRRQFTFLPELQVPLSEELPHWQEYDSTSSGPHFSSHTGRGPWDLFKLATWMCSSVGGPQPIAICCCLLVFLSSISKKYILICYFTFPFQILSPWAFNSTVEKCLIVEYISFLTWLHFSCLFKGFWHGQQCGDCRVGGGEVKENTEEGKWWWKK